MFGADGGAPVGGAIHSGAGVVWRAERAGRAERAESGSINRSLGVGLGFGQWPFLAMEGARRASLGLKEKAAPFFEKGGRYESHLLWFLSASLGTV